MKMYLVQVGTGYALVEEGRQARAVALLTKDRTTRQAGRFGCDNSYPPSMVREATPREVENWGWLLQADRVLKGAKSKKAKRETVMQSPLFSTRELAALEEVAA